MKIINSLREFIKDEKGAVLTVETVGYTILIGGIAALAGFAYTGLARGKISDFVGDIQDLKAISDPIDPDGNSGYTVTSNGESRTGIMTEGKVENQGSSSGSGSDGGS